MSVREPYSASLPLLARPVQRQLSSVSRLLYGAEPLAVMTGAASSEDWRVTDGLVASASSAYAEELSALSKAPRAYRVDAARLTRHGEAPRETSYEAPEEQEEKQQEEGEEAYPDPFALARGWVEREDELGRSVFVHEESRRTQRSGPETWTGKVTALAALTPRGGRFLHRESDEERRRRARVAQQHGARGEAEVRRRVESPSEQEQVQDTLLALLRRVERRCAHTHTQRHRHGRGEGSWHPALAGHRLRRLGEGLIAGPGDLLSTEGGPPRVTVRLRLLLYDAPSAPSEAALLTAVARALLLPLSCAAVEELQVLSVAAAQALSQQVQQRLEATQPAEKTGAAMRVVRAVDSLLGSDAEQLLLRAMGLGVQRRPTLRFDEATLPERIRAARAARLGQRLQREQGARLPRIAVPVVGGAQVRAVQLTVQLFDGAALAGEGLSVSDLLALLEEGCVARGLLLEAGEGRLRVCSVEVLDSGQRRSDPSRSLHPCFFGYAATREPRRARADSGERLRGRVALELPEEGGPGVGVERLRVAAAAAERALQTGMGGQGLTREQLRLVRHRDRCVHRLCAAEKRLEQRAQGGRSQETGPLSFLGDDDDAGADNEHVLELARRRSAAALARARRERERVRRQAMHTQRAWVLRALIAGCADPGMEAEVKEEIRRAALLERHAEAEVGATEVAAEAARARAAGRVRELNEERATGELFGLALSALAAPFAESEEPSVGVAEVVALVEGALSAMGAAQAESRAALAASKARERARAAGRRSQQLAAARGQVADPAVALEGPDSEPEAEAEAEEPELWRVLRRLHWPLVVAAEPAFRQCLLRLPCAAHGRVTEDELIQVTPLARLTPP